MELTLEISLGIATLSFISFAEHGFLFQFPPFLLLLTFLALDSRERRERDDTSELSVCES